MVSLPLLCSTRAASQTFSSQMLHFYNMSFGIQSQFYFQYLFIKADKFSYEMEDSSEEAKLISSLHHTIPQF